MKKRESRKERISVIKYEHGKKSIVKKIDEKKKKPIANTNNESTKKS